MNKKIVILFFIIYIFLTSTHIHAQSQANSTTSVTLGGNHFILFGYTSPFAKTILEGRGIYETTKASKTGYYEFDNVFSPLTSQELCINSQDTLGHITPPLCLPPFPISYNAHIGPVILPPSISVNKDTILVGEEVKLTGKTIPNSKVNINFFADTQRQSTNLFFTQVKNTIDLIPNMFIKPVDAVSLPPVSTVSDTDGNYSVSVPTQRKTQARIFVRSQYDTANSPNSFVLHLNILTWFDLLLAFLYSIVLLLGSHWLILSFLFELLILLFFLGSWYFKPYSIISRALVLYKAPPKG